MSKGGGVSKTDRMMQMVSMMQEQQYHAMQIEAYNQMNDAANKQLDVAKKTQREQQAVNVASADAERRKQIREARIKRAQMIQANMNAGAYGSSGMEGGISNIATQLASNMGENNAAVASGNLFSLYNQQNAEYTSLYQQAQANYSFYGDERRIWADRYKEYSNRIEQQKAQRKGFGGIGGLIGGIIGAGIGFASGGTGFAAVAAAGKGFMSGAQAGGTVGSLF